MNKEEAMKILKDFHDKSALFSVRTALETLHPELVESEDEKIRKRIIALVNAHGQGMYKGDMLAWLENIPYTIDHEKREGFHLGYKAGLEKQGEKKPIEEVNGEDYGIDGLWHAQRILEETLGNVDGYQTDDGILDHKAAITAVKKLYKQKPAKWSEEDETYLNTTIAYLKDAHEFKKTAENCIDWLKSLKQKIGGK